jgi:hypothetical protein
MEQGIGLTSALAEFNIDTERRHQELLEILSTQSSSYDNISLVGMVTIDCTGLGLTALLRLNTVFSIPGKFLLQKKAEEGLPLCTKQLWVIVTSSCNPQSIQWKRI